MLAACPPGASGIPRLRVSQDKQSSVPMHSPDSYHSDAQTPAVLININRLSSSHPGTIHFLEQELSHLLPVLRTTARDLVLF